MSSHAEQFIDGQLVDSPTTGKALDPSASEKLGTYADGGDADATRAIEVARRTFDTTDWSRDRTLRNKVLTQMADLLEQRSEEFIQALARGNAKPCARPASRSASPFPSSGTARRSP